LNTEQAVYLMKRRDGAVKVGISCSPKSRRGQLESELGINISIDSIWAVDGIARDVERRAHRILRQDQIQGEWFGVEIPDAVSAVMQAASELGLAITKVESFSSDDTEPMTIRLPRDVIRAIDEARRQEDPIPTRTDIVRHAVIDWLTRAGLLEGTNK
jgi:Meiotically up-regulated gene 113